MIQCNTDHCSQWPDLVPLKKSGLYSTLRVNDTEKVQHSRVILQFSSVAQL